VSISVSIKHKLGAFPLDVSFQSSGRFTALFGASGSGKTSVVNAIAGLLRPDQARIEIDGTVLTDTDSGTFLPTHRRKVGYVFQDARLFPHLTVDQNLRFGQWFNRQGKHIADVRQVVDLLGLDHLLNRRPAALSGGEKQRVAIGRALLSSPRVLLMDEPLASLDQLRKAEILPYLERLRDEVGIPMIYVSHSVAEVARLATDIVVLASGRTAAYGPADEIMRRLELVPPEERDEAGVIIDTAVERYDPHFGMTTLAAGPNRIFVAGEFGAAGTPIRIRVKARDVMIATERPVNISALNILGGRIGAMTEADASSINVEVDCGGQILLARITRQSSAALGLAAARPVYAVVKAVSVMGSARA
jgi:molybdate transport system ATP-binding protein